MAFGIVFLIFIHAAWTTTRLRRAEASLPQYTRSLPRITSVSRDTNFSQAKNVAPFLKEVDKNSKWRDTMETRVFSAEKVDGKSLFAPAYPSELPTNLGSRNTRLSWLAIRGKSTGVEDSWLLPAPVNRHDLRSFKRRPVPYDGCMWTGDGNSCTWSEMSATVVVYENIKTPPRNSLGVCGSAGKSELITEPTAAGENDERVFVPLDIAQSAYFAHFIDCLMPKLVYALELRAEDPLFFKKLYIFLPQNFASDNTYAVLKALDVDWTHAYPDENTVFRALIWTCHTPPISPRQGELIRRAFLGSRRKVCSGDIAYASRTPGTTRNGRHITNNVELIQSLKTMNRTVHVLSGTEPISWLRERLSQSCLLVGEHGTALANMVWLPDDAAVIELDGFGMYTIMWVLANVFGLKYGWLDHHKTPNTVEPQALVALVNMFLAKPGVA